MDHSVCRTCLRSPETLFPLFENTQLGEKILTIASVWINADDKLPKKICGECISNINLCYNFRKVIINSDLELKERCAALKNTFYSYPISETIQNDKNCEEESPEESKFKTNVSSTESDEDRCVDDDSNLPETHTDTLVNNHKDLRTQKPGLTFTNMLMYHAKQYKCKECDFTSKEYSKWQNHRRTNHSDPGICNVCGKTMRSDNLQKHIKSHTESPVECKECGKMFKNSASLRSHVLIHSGVIYTCKLCGKCYKYRGEYNRHLKRHSWNGIKTVECSLCDKLFMDKRSMKKHIRTHTGERPFVCEYCHKGYTSTYALKTHIRQHTNEKPYICEYCSIGFPQKVSLMTHIKSKHNNNSETVKCEKIS